MTWNLWCSHFNFLQNQTKLKTQNAKEHFPSQSSSYLLRRLQKKIFFDCIVTSKKTWKILSHFCGLFRIIGTLSFNSITPVSHNKMVFVLLIDFLPTNKNSTLWSSRGRHFFLSRFALKKKGIGIHFRSPLPNINTCILPPHQLCIPPLSDGQHCLTANREPRPWKMLFFHEFFFTAKKNLKYKVKNGWFSSPANRVMG